MPHKLVTLQRHVIEQQARFPSATGDFTLMLLDLMTAAKLIAREVNKAGLAEVLGDAGHQNVQDELVMKLDEFAQDRIYKAMDHGGHLCCMASEESAELIPIPPEYPHGRYVLCFDPLDGSSNIDANVSIGTIFSVHRRKSTSGPGTLEDVLQVGNNIVCAGYVIYGPSTMLVYSTASGVSGFTLDPSIGEFCLSHEDIRTPERGKIYSANEGNAAYWGEADRAYIEHLKTPEKASGRPYSARYIGSLVADFHRNLLYGGVFLYPADRKDPKKPQGKLRLLYEAQPLAFIAEQAGGAASDGTQRILDIVPRTLHDRTPLCLGAKLDVQLYDDFVRRYGGR
ncbi:MAG: class 1 fructose-bisphosphatase [Candidatus Brocadiae bacterium]|nr:class 1 fructose-bisphosphatase [Candidatus Brocadiia bacterium]